MGRHWLALSFALLVGCSRTPQAALPYEPPIKTDTTFTNLSRILTAIPKSADLRLYRGLPSEFWEPERRTQELSRAKTIKFHGYPFYEEPVSLQEADAGRLSVLLSSGATFRRHDEKKLCSGYSPEFAVEWRAGGDSTRALLCLECAEVKWFDAQCELYCDLNSKAKESLQLLLGYLKLDDASGRPSP